MKRKIAFLLAMLMLMCVCCTACGDDAKDEKEELEELQEEIEALEKELDELKTQESTLKAEINDVPVPKFIGRMYYTEIEDVDEYAEKFDLKIVWGDANNPDCKVGEVFKQSPAAGKMVEKGATVTLYVNNATPKEISLDVKAKIEGVHKDEVRELLQEAGFEVKEELCSSDLIEVDHVIKIDIEKGKSYPHSKVVTMTVSTGPAKRVLIDFPDFIIGQAKTAAVDILKNYGFVGFVSFVTVDYTDEQFAQEGVVMGIKIDGELLVELPDTIDSMAELTLVISSGEKAE